MLRDWSEVKNRSGELMYGGAVRLLLEAIAEIEQLRQDIETLVAEHRNARDSLAASDRENGRLRQEKAELVDACKDGLEKLNSIYHNCRPGTVRIKMMNLLTKLEGGEPNVKP